MPGIYKIINQINGKLYVGATTRPFDERWWKHKSDLRKHRHGNIHLQRAWNKYGETVFRFEIVEEMENPTPRLLAEKEEFHAKILGSSYNIAPFDRPFVITYGRKLSKEHIEKLRACQLGRKWTDEEKKKLSVALTGHFQPPCSDETRKRLSAATKGKLKGPMSVQHKKNLSNALRGKNLGRICSPETKEKIRKNRIGICRGESHVNYKGKFIFSHPNYGNIIASQCDMVRNYGMPECKASLLCLGKRKSHKQWTCKGKAE